MHKRDVVSLGSVSSVVLAVLMPKCPLCVAALLSALGLSAGVTGWIAPVARPLCYGLAALALLYWARLAWRALSSRAAAGACTCPPSRADRGALAPANDRTP